MQSDRSMSAMKLVFVYWGYENAGSMLDLRGYARAAKALGHEMMRVRPAQSEVRARLFPGPRRCRRGRFRLRVDDLAAARRPAGLDPVDRSGAAPPPRRHRLRRRLQRSHRVQRRLQSPHRGIECVLDGGLRQPLGQDLPADLAPAAEERAAVPVPHLRSDLGDALRLPRQGIQHDLCRPHQVPVARHVEGVARHRNGARAGRPRRAGGGGLAASHGLHGVGRHQGQLLRRPGRT